MEENQIVQNQSANPTPPVPPAVQTPVAQPVPNVNPPAGGPKPKFPLAIIIGVILFLLIAGSAAGFYVFKQSLKTAAKPTPMPIVQQPIPSPTPDPTANWKTYMGTDFTIKYPPDLDQKCTPPYVYLCSNTLKESNGSFSYFISIIPDSSLSTYPPGINYTQDSINGIRVYETSNAFEIPFCIGNTSCGTEEVYFERPDSTYVMIMFSPYDPKSPFPQQEKYYNLFNQMLTTFRFTHHQTVDTSNWKTYTGVNFSVKYPLSLVLDNNKANPSIVSFNDPDLTSLGAEDQPVGFSIITEPNPDNLTLQEWISQQAETAIENFSTGVKEPVSSPPSDNYFFMHGGKIYDFYYIGPSFDYHNLYLQGMFSTLKFTN